MKKYSQYKVNELDNPTEVPAKKIGEQPISSDEPGQNNVAKQQAAEKGAEGTVDKDEKIKVHVFRYVGSDGDGLVFAQKRDEEKMKSENWQYLGEFSLPGALVNQLPRNEDKDDWRVIHKNG